MKSEKKEFEDYVKFHCFQFRCVFLLPLYRFVRFLKSYVRYFWHKCNSIIYQMIITMALLEDGSIMEVETLEADLFEACGEVMR